MQKLRQAELGDKLGLPQSHISKIEQGLTDPRLSTVREMARILELELVLVPKNLLPALDIVLHGKDPLEPMWRPDEEEDDSRCNAGGLAGRKEPPAACPGDCRAHR